MSTRILKPSELKTLQPMTGLLALYQPEKAPYRFQAKTLEEARQWQAKTRLALHESIGMLAMPEAPLVPEVIEEVDKGAYVRQKILLHTSEYTVMPVYILKPKHLPEPLPVVIAFAGHGYGVKDVVGLWEDGSERDTPDGYHSDFAVELCKNGFLVAAPEISCFGERVNDYAYLKPDQEVPYTCHHTSALAFHLGGSTIGLRVFDGMKLVDYLETRSDVDIKRLGAMGISGGGMHTLYSTCMDERIQACVISGYFCSFRYSIFGMHHCTCNYIPGMHKFGEIYDLAGLIAPRPMLVEAGDHDPIFPLEGVREAVARAKEVYQVFGAEGQVETDIFEGRHRISGARAYNFLKEKLCA